MALITISVLALCLPVAAYAWSQPYAVNTIFSPDGMATSGNNSGLDYDHFSWGDNYGGDPSQIYGQATLCDTSGSCYTYDSSTSGLVNDTRSIAYGHAKCHSKSSNFYPIYVYECYVDNEH